MEKKRQKQVGELIRRNFKLYDRWGELVWSGGDYAFANRFDHFWDGVFKGKKAMQGVYVFSRLYFFMVLEQV